MHIALLLGVCAAARRNAFDLFAEGSYGSSTPVIVRSGNNPHAKITYLTLRGLADLPVLMMEFTGLPYHATYLGREQMKEVKHKFPLGRVPVLELDGVTIAQSASIVRHIAATTELMPQEHELKAKVDMMFETVQELFADKWFDSDSIKEQHNSGSGFENLEVITRFSAIGNNGKVAATGVETTPLEKTLSILATFEDILEEGDRYDVWLVGKHPTYADLALFLKLEAKVELPLKLGEKMLGLALPFPKLSALQEEIRNHPNVQSYFNSGRRMPRVQKRANDDGSGHDYYYVDLPPLPEAAKHGGEL